MTVTTPRFTIQQFVKKDFSEEALKAAADAKPKKDAKAPKADKKAAKKEDAPMDDSGVADPAELIGKAATAKAKAEGKVAADKKAKK